MFTGLLLWFCCVVLWKTFILIANKITPIRYFNYFKNVGAKIVVCLFYFFNILPFSISSHFTFLQFSPFCSVTKHLFRTDLKCSQSSFLLQNQISSNSDQTHFQALFHTPFRRTLSVPGIIKYRWVPDFPVLSWQSKTTTNLVFCKTR